MAVTIKDIAKSAGLDIRVVSLTLRDHPHAQAFRPETRERVLKIAKELGYQRNLLATSMRTGVVNTIAVVGSFLDSIIPFTVSQVLGGILNESTRNNYNVRVYPDSDLAHVFSEISGNRIPYVISMSVENEIREKTAEFCRKSRLRLVYLWEHPHAGFPAVSIDNQAAAARAVRFLISSGHRRIGLISVPNRFHYIEERNAGYFQAMKESGIPVMPELVSCDDDVEEKVGTMLALPARKRPTALFGVSDSLMIRAQHCAAKMGFRLPEDLSTFGFGNMDMAPLAMAPLSSVEESFVLRGETAVDVLIGKKCVCRKNGNGVYQVPVSLVNRTSVVPCGDV